MSYTLVEVNLSVESVQHFVVDDWWYIEVIGIVSTIESFQLVLDTECQYC